MSKSIIDNKKCAQQILNNMDGFDFPNIRNMKCYPEWIKVSDKLPEEEQYVLYYCSNYEKIDKTQYYNGFFLGVSTAFNNVTHWMPLPSPPEIEK